MKLSGVYKGRVECSAASCNHMLHLFHTLQALETTFATESAAAREVGAALRAREERAAHGYLARLEREAEKLERLQEEQEVLKAKCIQ